jgi:hypothetical protein
LRILDWYLPPRNDKDAQRAKDAEHEKVGWFRDEYRKDENAQEYFVYKTTPYVIGLDTPARLNEGIKEVVRRGIRERKFKKPDVAAQRFFFGPKDQAYLIDHYVAESFKLDPLTLYGKIDRMTWRED